MAARKRPVWAKRPSSPYKPKADGSSYIELVGGPLNGAWMRVYFPAEPELYKTMGALYRLSPLPDLNPEFDAERQMSYQFIGYEEGMSDEELCQERT